MLDRYAKHLQADIIVSTRITYSCANQFWFWFKISRPPQISYPKRLLQRWLWKSCAHGASTTDLLAVSLARGVFPRFTPCKGVA